MFFLKKIVPNIKKIGLVTLLIFFTVYAIYIIFINSKTELSVNNVLTKKVLNYNKFNIFHTNLIYFIGPIFIFFVYIIIVKTSIFLYTKYNYILIALLNYISIINNISNNVNNIPNKVDLIRNIYDSFSDVFYLCGNILGRYYIQVLNAFKDTTNLDLFLILLNFLVFMYFILYLDELFIIIFRIFISEIYKYHVLFLSGSILYYITLIECKIPFLGTIRKNISLIIYKFFHFLSNYNIFYYSINLYCYFTNNIYRYIVILTFFSIMFIRFYIYLRKLFTYRHITYILQLYDRIYYEYFTIDLNNIILLEKLKNHTEINKLYFSNLNLGLLKFKEDIIALSLLKDPNTDILKLYCSKYKGELMCGNKKVVGNETMLIYLFFNSKYTMSINRTLYHKYINNVENSSSFISNNLIGYIIPSEKIKIPLNLYVYNSNTLPLKKIIYVDPNHIPFFEHLIYNCGDDDFNAVGLFYLKIKNSSDFYNKVHESILPSGIILRTIPTNRNIYYIKYLKILSIFYFFGKKRLKFIPSYFEFILLRPADYKTKVQELSLIPINVSKIIRVINSPVQEYSYYYNRRKILNNIDLFKMY